METQVAAVAAWPAFSLAVAVLVTSCGGGAAGERVVFRLGPASFASANVGAHAPVAKIGNQLRQVAYAREHVLATPFPGMTPRSGVIRSDVALPPAAQ